ncbi:MAG: adenosylmethionine--8-amino-7-oxononanoate transaminase [Pseudomonadales bacterium]|nr:adenosylmethionine--8-amino-7-oxononanoate transaminase [Pseudomonadales bacterium]
MKIPQLTNEQLTEFDQQHLWHPYAAMLDATPAHAVESGEGAYLNMQNGDRLLDAMSSWWCAIHGYNHPQLNAAVLQQMSKISHVMFGGLTHQPAVALGQRLLALLPQGLEHIFYADSGSVAVEVAIKMALQYSFSAQCSAEQGGQKAEKAQPSGLLKNKLLTIRGGYHGDTFAAMSVCDPVGGMHEHFAGALTRQFFAERPAIAFADEWQANDIQSFRQLIEQHQASIAAVILEPVVQGAGGMYFYHPQYLREVRRLCDQHQILLIFDEIATGFGRTGKMFACEHADVTPDILCVGKALTGGYMTLAATIASKKVVAGIEKNSSGVLMHGPTFMANPLACAVACASLDLLLDGGWQRQVADIECWLEKGLAQAKDCSNVEDVRVLGAIGVIELKQVVDYQQIQRLAMAQGVWLRPFGKLVYTMPPYICSAPQIAKICQAMCAIARLPV